MNHCSLKLNNCSGGPPDPSGPNDLHAYPISISLLTILGDLHLGSLSRILRVVNRISGFLRSGITIHGISVFKLTSWSCLVV